MSKKYTNKNIRHGACKEHGEKAHAKDHYSNSRRNFLFNSGILLAGSSMMLGSSKLQALASSPLLATIDGNSNNDRILVIINLNGGNDGLNTVVPRGNDTYYNLRPTLAVQEPDMWALSPEFGMPNYMSDWQSLWGDGKMAAIHSVAYPNQNYSHFRSTDIWLSGSDSLTELSTGWVGRYLDYEYPAFVETPANYPVGLQIGYSSSLLFAGAGTSMGLTINNPTEFYQIAQTGQLYSMENLPECTYGSELSFMRQTANNTVRYAETINQAYTSSEFYSNYPANNGLADQLSMVARLIKGGLKTKVFLVELGGFDTHDSQAAYHPTLLNYLASAVKAFYDDLTQSGDIGRVLTITTSEFGRTVGENGSYGTDHGQGAPLFVFGETISGGFKGTFGELSDIGYEDQSFTTDFRSIYASILKDWFCIDQVIVNGILGANLPVVDDLLPVCTPDTGSNNTAVLLGHNPAPNNMSIVQIKYAVLQAGSVKIQIKNNAGQVKATLMNAQQVPGSYTIDFDRTQYGLTPGNYIYQIQTGGKNYNRRIKLM